MGCMTRDAVSRQVFDIVDRLENLRPISGRRKKGAVI
jgi:hypothetical protein